MRLLGLAIGVIVILVGAICLASPDVLLSLGHLAATPGGLYVVAALRIAIGLVLIFAAAESRAPRTLRVIGVFVIIAGLTTPWFGVERARAVLDWFTKAGPSFMRLTAGVAMAIGGFLSYVFRPAARPRVR
jgi:hypothetical protein